MVKAAIAAAVLSLALAAAAFAVEGNPPAKAPDANFEKRQSDVLKMIDARIARLQKEKECVQAAKNMDDLKACREKFHPEPRRDQGNMNRQDGPQGGPRGQQPPQGGE